MKKIKDLNDIRRDNVCGIYKHWIYKSNTVYHKICDYMQKINYSIQDLNTEIEIMEKVTAKDIVYIISLVDWIIESCNAIIKEIKPDILDNFNYSKQTELNTAKEFLKALRSFVIAHPLSTDRHEKYGFDGNFICIDISSSINPLLLINNHLEFFYHLDYEGIKSKTFDKDDNFYLHSYSEKDDGMKYQRVIGSQIELIYNVAELYIDNLYELDNYLYKQKKVNY